MGIALLALPSAAQDCCLIEGVNGRGVAANEHQRAHFALSAVKATCEHDSARVRGTFALQTMTERGQLSIETDRIQRLERDGGTVAISGPAVLTLSNRNGEQRVLGVVHVVAQDGGGMDLGAAGSDDALTVRFESRDLTWAFRGGVVEGNIEVFVRRRCECQVQFAHGRGAAVNRNEQVAGFNFEVVSRRCPEEDPRLVGRFAFQTTSENRSLSISLREVVAFESDGTNAAFRGPAVAIIRSREGTREIRGLLRVRVHDGKDGDTLAILFEAENFRYAFEGRVVRGEIVVGGRG
jgi:hypothetical protein